MNARTSVIRDFVYVDLDRLYSMYAQINQGLVSHVLDSIHQGETNTTLGKVPDAPEEPLEHKIGASTSETRERILHDYIYSRFEETLRANILDINTLTVANYPAHLANAQLIKVTGLAQVEDFDRLSFILENFTEVSRAVGYLSHGTKIKELKEQLAHYAEKKGQRNSNSKSGAKPHVISPEEKALLAQLELYLNTFASKDLEQGFFDRYSFIVNTFIASAFDVVVMPEFASGGMAVRGIAEPKWLRTSPQLLRRRFGIPTQRQWTMVGQITQFQVPEQTSQNESPDLVIPEEIEPQKGTEGLLAALGKMISAINNLERNFIQVGGRDELFITPIAIYQNIPLEVVGS